MYWIRTDSTIVHLSLFYKITCKNVQFYNVEHSASLKNQQWLKSIGKWLNKLWYIPPVVYIPSIRMKLIYVYIHDKKSARCTSEKKQITGQYKPNSVKNSNSNFYMPRKMYSEFLCQGNMSKRSLSTYMKYLIIYNHLSMSMHYCDN